MEDYDISSGNVPERAKPKGWAAVKKGESQIAIDATGFSTKTCVKWRNILHSGTKREWLKLHAAVTTVLKAIPSMEVTDGEASDSPQLAGLLCALPIDDLEAVAADSAYLSRRNCSLIEALGAKPYIKLKRNVTLRS